VAAATARHLSHDCGGWTRAGGGSGGNRWCGGGADAMEGGVVLVSPSICGVGEP
jgi:hypothetical protein